MRYRHRQATLYHAQRDPVWSSARLIAQPYAWRWLSAAGSLTWQLKQLSSDFSVELLSSGHGMVLPDEWRSIRLPRPGQVWQRDVCLRLDDEPMVVAHSVTSLAGVAHVWRSLRTLARRPLAEVLFTDPGVLRLPLSYARVAPGHPLYRNVHRVHPALRETLWARRSVFVREHMPLMVTEVFLPALWNRIHDCHDTHQ